MEVFSDRYQLKPEKEIQLNDVDYALFNRIWNVFYRDQREKWEVHSVFQSVGAVENLLDSFGQSYEYPTTSFEKDRNVEKLKNYLMGSEWYEIYDFLERYLKIIEPKKQLEKQLNIILEEEKSGYRIVKGLVTPITNNIELTSLAKSLSTKYDAVNKHFEKALSLYSSRKKPDYDNSIKESISAVEAICCIITGESGKQATLGNTLKKLKDNEVHIHPAMEKAFLSLYGYTSDESGIRHGGIDFKGASAEDAKYMLISCSAFVNYLIEKWAKVNQ